MVHNDSLILPLHINLRDTVYIYGIYFYKAKKITISARTDLYTVR